MPEPSSQEKLDLIFSYLPKISLERNIDKALMLMADMGKALIGADRCTLWLWDKRKKILWSKVAHGLDRIQVPDHAGFVGVAVQSGQTIIVQDAYQDPRFNPEVDKKTGYRTKGVLVIPIYDSNGEIMGAYQAINKVTGDGSFTEEDLNYLSLAASYSGRSMEVVALNQEIEETQKEIIFVMGEIGESRSKETGNHVKRVAEYSKVLALGCGLSEEETELLRLASPMHDIGKVAIPDSVLKKPGKLTDEEFAIMQSHTILGYNLLKNSQRPIIKAAATVAHEHHEKWNGRGYPRGLKGEEIHIFGRITAVADVFDALGSDRVYKKAWELERIYALFREERGQHFDPGVIDAFFANLDEILRIREMYQDAYEEKQE